MAADQGELVVSGDLILETVVVLVVMDIIQVILQTMQDRLPEAAEQEDIAVPVVTVAIGKIVQITPQAPPIPHHVLTHLQLPQQEEEEAEGNTVDAF